MADDDRKTSAALASLGLEAPLHELSRPNVDEWAVRRMWLEIVRRRAPRPRPSRRRVVVLYALAALALVALFFGARRWPSGELGLDPSARGPLLTRDARRFEGLEAPARSSAAGAGAPARVDFADGSSIEAAPGTRIEALASSADEFVLLMRRGRAQFRVTPGGPRRWRIQARHAQVDVVGTVLWVEESDATGTRVQVDVGRVLVRSPELPGGAQSLGAGQSLELGVAPRSAALPASPEDQPARADALPPPRRAEPAPSLELRAVPPPAPAPRSPSRAVAPARPRASQLWEEADQARRRGQPARAAALLGLLLRDHAGDSQAPLAAFTLGVLQLERLERPAAAADSFQRALELGVAAALREDAYLRWAEALDAAGARGSVAAVRAEYLRLYPHGRHRAAIERLAAR